MSAEPSPAGPRIDRLDKKRRTTEPTAAVRFAASLGLLPVPDFAPPVAILPDPSQTLSQLLLDPHQSRLLATVEASLARLPVFEEPAAVGQSLTAAWWAVVQLAACLPACGVDAERIPITAPTQAYFRTRMAPVDSNVAFAHAVMVVGRCLEDLRFAPVAGSDLARETAAIRLLLSTLGGPPSEPGVPATAEHDIGGGLPIEQRWSWRWIVAHQLHGLFSVHAAAAIASATRSIEVDELTDAMNSLELAAILVEGLAPARAHAAAVPADFYNDVLRPTMRPPANPTALSGGMHPESRVYRREVRRLLAAAPESFDELSRRHPTLAGARERLLNADLVDYERHVCLVEAVVGAATSIAQSERGSDNAVSVLRKMRHRRATAYAPFVRYGDTLGR